MIYFKGDILTPDGFKKGYLELDVDRIVEIHYGSPPEKPFARGLIVPTFVNAHVHIGDSFVRKKSIEIPKDVKELVAPPNGLKYKLLNKASEKEIVEGMETSIDEMIEAGISYFCDFREGGVNGIYQLKKASKNKRINSVILSRPLDMNFDKNEVDLLLNNSDGIGVSSISDWEYSELRNIARYAKQRRKLFALHASEAIREDIELILDLKPDFLVHMVAATESDLIRVRDEGIPVVLCPRSNAFFNLKIDVKLMKRVGVELMLGTDNAMLNSPDIVEELRYFRDNFGCFSIQELLNMVTYTPRKVLNLDDCIHGLDSSSDFVVLDRESLNPIYIS